MGHESQATSIMSLWEFCKEWVRRAWVGRFKRAKELHGVAALVCGFLAVLVRELWPEMSPLLSALTWTPFVVFGAVFIAVLAYGLLTAPYEIYTAAADKLRSAEGVIRDLQRAPELLCAFVDPGDMRSSAFAKVVDATVHRTALKNLSQTTQLTGVEVSILRYTDLQTGVSAPINRRLRDMRGDPGGVVTPDAVRYFDIVAVRPNKSPPRVYFGPWPEGISPHTGGPGRYQLEIQAVSATAPPVSITFLLEVDSSGKVKLTTIL